MMPHTERRGMITSFFVFAEKFKLHEIEKKIKAWSDFIFFSDDTLAYLAFMRVKVDPLGCGFQRDPDPTLHKLYKLWNAQKLSDEVSNALSCLPEDEQKAFCSHFGDLKDHNSLFSKDELIVHIAAHIDSYPYRAVIMDEYEKFISTQNSEIKRLKKDIKKRLPDVVKRFEGRYWNLFDPGMIDKYLTGTNWRDRQRQDQIALTGLYFEGKIPLSVLKEHLIQTKGGRKILNKL